MKRLFIVLTAIGASALVIQTAQASPLFSEAFDYTAGSALQGQVNLGNSTAWSGGNTGLTIGSGDLTYPGLPDQGGNELSIANATAGSSINTFANQTSGQVYYSFLLDVTTVDGANDYITSLNPGTTTPGGSTDALAVYLYSTGTLGIRTAGASTVHTSSALSLDTTYFVVVDYDFAATAVNLWLDPVPGASQPAATLTLAGNGTVTAIDDVGFKAQATTGDFLVDNLLIGTTWADVTPVPEPSTLALAGLGMLGLAFARRMRR
ncbi:MAG: PEP-CTERM sorting domain-containing protein [Verrucomicrobiia bacterium]